MAAALAKSSTVAAQLQHATSVDDVTPTNIRAQRRDSISSVSSDEFHDAASGEGSDFDD